MAAADQKHPLAWWLILVLPPSHYGGLCVRKSVLRRGSESSDTPPFVPGTMIQCSTLCTKRKVMKFPCFWCLVFGAQFQHFLEFFLPSFFAMQLALVSMITVTFISSLGVFSLQRTRRFRTRGD